MSSLRTCRPCMALRVVLANLLLICVVLFVSACDGNYLVWSSDGKLGAVVGAKGLRVCDGEGTISPVLVDKAGMFRWIPQEHQGLLVGYDYVNKWSSLKPLLTSEQEKQISQESLTLRSKLFTYHGDQKKFAESALRTFNYPLEAALHLHATAAPEIDKMAAHKWPAYLSVKVPIFYIKLAQVESQSAKLGNVINRGIDEIVELRPSPNGKYLACVKHEHAQERNLIMLLPLDGSGKATEVAYDTNSYPDWSADSRTIYYTRANTKSEPDLLKGHGLHEGGLFKVEVLDASGKPVSPLKPQRLANLVFDNKAPVRSLKDGRLLFLSREIRLPGSVNAAPSAALFSLDGNRVDTLIRRTDDVVYFEPSPEQDQLAVTLGGGGGLLVCKSNGAEPIELCNGKDLRLSGLLPQWKSNQELSYGTETPATTKGGKPGYAVVLWSRGAAAARDLSKAWGKEAASEINIHRDIFQEAMTGVMEDMDRNSGSGKPKP